MISGVYMKYSVEEKKVSSLLNYLENQSREDFNKWLTGVNIFEVLKISSAEIRHSNILGWLITPNENHSLGDKFFEKVILKIIENNSSVSEISMIDALLKDFSDAKVFRESKNDIDILFSSKKNKFNLIIENKTWTADHDNQLKKYREFVDKEYSSYKNLFVYLTPYGDQPIEADESERMHWKILSYKEISDILADIVYTYDIDEKVRYILTEYNDNLKRNILKDEELEQLTKDIYSKHKEVLDIIFLNRPDYIEDFKFAVRNEFENFDDGNVIKNKIPFLDGNIFRIRFRTKKLDKFLNDNFDEDNDKLESSIYWYEIASDGNEFKFWLVLKEPEYFNELPQKIQKFYNQDTKKYHDWGKIYRRFHSINPEEAWGKNLDQEVQNFIKESLKEIQEFENSIQSTL